MFFMIGVGLIGWTGCEGLGDPNHSYTLTPEIEGPRGYITRSGPWLLRIYAPNHSSTTPHTIRAHIGEESAINLPITVSGRDDIHFALIPEVEEGVEVRYLLVDHQELELTSEARFIYEAKTVNPVEEVLDPLPCVLRLTSPPPDQPISAQTDEAPTSGVQRTLSLEARRLINGLVTLEIQEERALALVVNGQVSFPRQTLPIGEQVLTFEGIGMSGERCAVVYRLTISP